MPRLDPLPDWSGRDVFVIGGGHSLRGFDWKQLHDKNTVGCNQAFALGSKVCKVVTFGDYNFWDSFHRDLEKYDGWVATNYLIGAPPKWLKFFTRKNEGLGTGRTLAWNNNTGCLATNIALMLGASRVFLLGMDMRLGPAHAKHHWHDMAIECPHPTVYDKFCGGFEQVNAALAATFPGRKVFNVTEGDSRLFVFPRITFADAGLVAPEKE